MRTATDARQPPAGYHWGGAGRRPRALAALIVIALGSRGGQARAEPSAPTVAPDRGGVLVIPVAARDANDARLGRIAARLAHRGIESVVAGDLVRPPPDPESGLVRARWRLDEGRRLRRIQRYIAAATADDQAIRALEESAFERVHLELLIEALIERGAVAAATSDPATAETLFLRALALDPNHELDAELHDEPTRNLFADVHRASRELRYGTLRIEVVAVPGAAISVDFGTPRDAPVSVDLPDGRHFVAVEAPGRHEVVALVPVRTARETSIGIRPPLSGDARAWSAALAAFRAGDAARTAALAEAVGLRFVLTASIGENAVGLALADGRSGRAIAGARATLSLDPSPDEIDAAVQRIIGAVEVIEPELAAPADTTPLYGRWWALGLMAAAVIGAGAATYLIVQGNAKTEYQFSP